MIFNTRIIKEENDGPNDPVVIEIFCRGKSVGALSMRLEDATVFIKLVNKYRWAIEIREKKHPCYLLAKGPCTAPDCPFFEDKSGQFVCNWPEFVKGRKGVNESRK